MNLNNKKKEILENKLFHIYQSGFYQKDCDLNPIMDSIEELFMSGNDYKLDVVIVSDLSNKVNQSVRWLS